MLLFKQPFFSERLYLFITCGNKSYNIIVIGSEMLDLVKSRNLTLTLAFCLIACISAEAQKLPKLKKPKKKDREHAIDMDSLSATMAPTIDLEEEEEDLFPEAEEKLGKEKLVELGKKFSELKNKRMAYVLETK